MNPQRWQQIEDLFHAARESGAGVLAEADPELRKEVERLLAHDSDEGSKLLDQQAAELIAIPTQTPISAGSRLGPYKIEGLLGEGGMGRIFRATDTRLGRSVAIKISNRRFSDRFELESRAIAALNHPHICTLYDVGPDYLVMELVDGETLAARLKRGKLAIEQVVCFGAQIAEALAAAHAKGIIHRDLKPANIMLTKSGVKVLDFGLAKSAGDPSLTAAGGMMGSPAYMAPEQFEGKPADARSDIYALGLVLREMAIGKRAEPSDTMPPTPDRVIKRCLEIDPDERWQSARDLKWELESCAIQPGATRPRSRSFVLAGALALVSLLVAGIAFLYFRESPPAQQAVRLSVRLPERSRPRYLAVSPDGRTIAVVLVKDGKQQLWVRALDALEPTALDGTDGASNPFWSPDSRSIAFFADSKLKKVAREGGPVQTLCDSLGAVGGTWNRSGDILIGALSGIQRVSAAGGALSETPADSIGRKLYPSFLPDGRHYLSTVLRLPTSTESGVWLSSMDSPESQHLLPDESNAEFIEPPPGSHVGEVLFTRSGTFMALPFDLKSLKPAGNEFPIAQGIAAGETPYWRAAASSQGVLAYVSGQSERRQYVWRDRQGKKLGSVGDSGGVVMISPDGKLLTGDQGRDIWVVDLKQGTGRQLTFEGAFNPIWSPEGRYVAYDKFGVGIFRKLANGVGQEEMLIAAKGLSVPKSWSPDGRFILYAQINPGTGADLLGIPVESNPKPFVVAQSPATEDQGQFSPDGHWVAYTSNESGQSEIYVVPFPRSASGGKWMVSRGGGVMPRWRRNGKELFYIAPDSMMMAVDVNPGPVFQSGAPHPLFQSDIEDNGIRTGPMSWDLSPDGNRFLIITDAPGDASLTVALNWRASSTK